MRILWLCSTPTPEIAKSAGIKSAVNVSWIVNTLKELKGNVNMCVSFPVNTQNMIEGVVDGVEYFGYPQKNQDPTIYNKETEQYLEEVVIKFNPEVIHIWGTEYPYTLAMINACEKLGLIDKTIISIQGLCSVIARHYYAALPNKIIKRYTIRDLIKRESIKKQKQIFEKRGSFEIEALKKAKHVIGRTDWDKACVTQINPDVNYHFCNETLRDSFYNNKWEYDNCEKHSVFVSQGYYPIKGLHFMIEALAILKQTYPDVKLYVGGLDLVNRGWKTASYGKYIKDLIKKYGLSENIQFTGMLNEQKMCEQYLKANVFVSPSSIENSPNSVGEAMLLGMPVVSSDVGGVKNLLTHGEEGYIYPYDEPYMLAYYIKNIFKSEEIAKKTGEKAKKKAEEIYSRKKNLADILNIYDSIKNN